MLVLLILMFEELFVKMIWTIPNVLTIFRIVLIPFFVVFFYLPFTHHYGVSVGIFVLAAFTDLLDGWIARYFEQSSQLGAFLDPVADKLMISTALVLIVSIYPYWWVAMPAAAIIMREIVVSALREWMAELGKRSIVQVSFLGKVKTSCQMISMVVLLIKPTYITNFWVVISFILLYISVILTIHSMCLYLKAAYISMKYVEEDTSV